MSLNKIAASTPYLRTGCKVSSVTRSGLEHASSIEIFPRLARYSGSDRPACRMYHTGACGMGCLRQALMKTESAVFTAVSTPRIVSHGPAHIRH
jgi:hypothetical protein